MKNLVLMSCVLFSVVTPFSFAKSSTVEVLNHNIERCFEQTKRGELASKRACRDVLRSGIVNRYNKAVAYHNRGVINLNLGNKPAALRDFRRARRLQPELELGASSVELVDAIAP